MGNYVKNFTETFDFDGDKITIVLKQLTRMDAMELMPAMANMQGMDVKHMTKDDMDNSNKFVEVAASILKDGGYIVSLSGLFIEGRTVSVDSDDMDLVYKDFYFTSFITSVAMFLIKHGSMSKATEKKSEGQSNTTQGDSKKEKPLVLVDDQ